MEKWIKKAPKKHMQCLKDMKTENSLPESVPVPRKIYASSQTAIHQKNSAERGCLVHPVLVSVLIIIKGEHALSPIPAASNFLHRNILLTLQHECKTRNWHF